MVIVRDLRAALAQRAHIHHLAHHDPLTNLLNRHAFMERLAEQMSGSRVREKQGALLFIDLDHFKRVNDAHGHDAGDRLLAAFGRVLVANLRKSDVACRYGGEEFCVLMPETDAAGAQRKIVALQKRWRVESLMQGAVGDAGTSFSAGVADSLCVSASWQALLKRADDELLTAKRAGRNRVLVAEA